MIIKRVLKRLHRMLRQGMLNLHSDRLSVEEWMCVRAERERLRAAALSEQIRILFSPDGHWGRSTGTISLIKGSSVVRLNQAHLPYAFDIASDFDYYFGAVEPVIRGARHVVDYSRPGHHTLVESKMRLLFTSLPESEVTTRLYLERAALSPGDVVLDLGAYCGGAAIELSKAVGETGRVYAFEPDAGSFAALKHNLKCYDCSNVMPVPKGVWSETQTLSFQAEGSLGSAIDGIMGRTSHLKQVEVISLEDACRDFDIQRLDFIKMDIEGAEVPVLRTARDLLIRFKPRLIIEPHLVGGVVNTEEIMTLLEDIGFSCEILVQSTLCLPLIFAAPR